MSSLESAKGCNAIIGLPHGGASKYGGSLKANGCPSTCCIIYPYFIVQATRKFKLIGCRRFACGSTSASIHLSTRVGRLPIYLYGSHAKDLQGEMQSTFLSAHLFHDCNEIIEMACSRFVNLTNVPFPIRYCVHASLHPPCIAFEFLIVPTSRNEIRYKRSVCTFIFLLTKSGTG